MTVWFRLKDDHCLWLRLVLPLPVKLERVILKSACARLGPLSGAGRHRLLEALGISHASGSTRGRSHLRGSAANCRVIALVCVASQRTPSVCGFTRDRSRTRGSIASAPHRRFADCLLGTGA